MEVEGKASRKHAAKYAAFRLTDNPRFTAKYYTFQKIASERDRKGHDLRAREFMQTVRAGHSKSFETSGAEQNDILLVKHKCAQEQNSTAQLAVVKTHFDWETLAK